ncbi:hypothetical protein ACFXAW_06225 [Streptomyces sp. NPDC059445]|uniref:hypothetical protein n=1 Tax=Streptomyces sp. NPDC059445 TaxID=3346832 RepID=UPI003688ADA2
MKTVFWILLAGFLTCVTGAALVNTARSDDRETLVGNVLLSLSVGWYMVTTWRRAYLAVNRRTSFDGMSGTRNDASRREDGGRLDGTPPTPAAARPT